MPALPEFQICINHEEIYIVTPVGRPIPGGWRAVGKTGSLAEVEAYLKANWRNRRPGQLEQVLKDAEAAARS